MCTLCTVHCTLYTVHCTEKEIPQFSWKSLDCKKYFFQTLKKIQNITTPSWTVPVPRQSIQMCVKICLALTEKVLYITNTVFQFKNSGRKSFYFNTQATMTNGIHRFSKRTLVGKFCVPSLWLVQWDSINIRLGWHRWKVVLE